MSGQGHGHTHGFGQDRRRLALAFVLTVTVLIAQAVGALLTGSLALLVDTVHMLADTGGLALALVAATLALRPRTNRHTWGLRRAEVLSATLQALLLLGIGIFALYEGIRRLSDPPSIPSGSLLVFGLIGLVANLLALSVLAGGRDRTLNMRAAFLEVSVDALGSVAVIVGAVLIATTGWEQADAVAGMAIAAFIVPRALLLLRASSHVLLERTPDAIDLAEVREHIVALPHVLEVHDLHVTRISSDLPVLTAHVVVEDSCLSDGHAATTLTRLQQCVAEHFDLNIEHSTFQLETASHRDLERLGHD